MYKRQGQHRVPEAGLLAVLELLTDTVHAQAQEGPQQQKTAGQRQDVGGREFEHRQQCPAHGEEANAVEQPNGRRTAEILPAQAQPPQRVAEADLAQLDTGFGTWQGLGALDDRALRLGAFGHGALR